MFYIWHNLHHLFTNSQGTYPDIPSYNGSKYINYETAKVKEVGEVVEDATNEKDPLFGDDGPPSDSDSSDDSSDSEVEGG